MSAREHAPWIFGLALSLAAVPVCAQEGAQESAENRFLLTGYGFATYTDDDATESFSAGFAPILLYRIGERVLFESELEFELEEEEVEVEVEYAQVDWLVHDRLTVVAGKFLTPFGSFIEKLHPAWINKLPTSPLPYQHGQSLVPFGQTGLQVRGGIPLGDGNRRLTYALFFSNGLRESAHGHEEEEVDGHGGDEPHGGGDEEEEGPIFLDGASFNGNGDLGAGGRVSVVPLRGLELAVSYLSGTYDESGVLEAKVRGVDLSYHHDYFDLRAEWLDSDTERGLDHDGHPLADLEVESWYVQPSLRLSVLPVYAFNKLELVARFADLDWGESDEERFAVGLNYYVTSSSIVRLAWERSEVRGHESESSVDAMFAIGF